MKNRFFRFLLRFAILFTVLFVVNFLFIRIAPTNLIEDKMTSAVSIAILDSTVLFFLKQIWIK